MVQTLINGIAEGSIYAIIAVGLVFIYKVTEVANFAQGELAMIATFVGFTGLQYFGVPLWVAIVLGLAASAALGYCLERWVLRPVLGSGLLGTTIVTLGIFYVLHGGALAIWGPEVHPFPSFFGTQSIAVAGILISPQHFAIMAAAFAAALGLSFLLRFTRIGLAMRAVPQNRVGATVIGLDVYRIYGLTWLIGAAVSAIAGFLLAPIMFLSTNMMVSPLINAFAAAVLGGLDSLMGAFVGGILLGVVENVIVAYTSSALKDSLAFLFIILALLLRPEGLFKRRRGEKV
jgi:branched-chain amino acid transport system permease protein